MNLTENQKAEIALAIRQHEQELREIRKNPNSYIDKIHKQVNMFNSAMEGKPLLVLRTFKKNE